MSSPGMKSSTDDARQLYPEKEARLNENRFDVMHHISSHHRCHDRIRVATLVDEHKLLVANVETRASNETMEG